MENEYNTSIEQSQLLMGLDLPVSSADGYWGKDSSVHEMNEEIPLSLIISSGCTPCWSIGNLQQLYEICWNNIDISVFDRMFADDVISCFIEDAQNGYLDFTRLT